MKIVVDKITGFSATTPLEIRDGKGRIFYTKETGGNITFNMPPGIYVSNKQLNRLPSPLRYVHGKLPKPERVLEIPKFNIIIAPNPNKCTVYFATGDIVMDPKMKELPRPNIQHILFHELGHFKYHTEWKCDLFSCVNMLKIGYNPSQCVKVMIHNLGNNRNDTVVRAGKVFDFMQSIKTA